MKLTIGSAIAGAALSLIATSAFAQATGASDTENGTAGVKIISPITVAQTTPLAFGTLASPAAQTVYTVNADASGTHTYTALAGSTVASGVFTVSGQSTYAYNITAPTTASAGTAITLTGAGSSANTISGTVKASKASGTLTSGTDTFYVGGAITVAANQAADSYSGTYTVTVAYQ